MRTPIPSLVVLACASSGAVAAENPSFRFDAKIGIPALSLLDGAKEKSPAILNDAARFFRNESSSRGATHKRVSNMPVVTPSPEIDYKLRTITPGESVDYKLIVKSPDIEVGL